MIERIADGYRKINHDEEWLDYYPKKPEKTRVGDEVDPVFTAETVQTLMQMHKGTFSQYWSLNEDEQKLLDDFVDQFCRMITGEIEQEAMENVIDDMLNSGKESKSEGENE